MAGIVTRSHSVSFDLSQLDFVVYCRLFATVIRKRLLIGKTNTKKDRIVSMAELCYLYFLARPGLFAVKFGTFRKTEDEKRQQKFGTFRKIKLKH